MVWRDKGVDISGAMDLSALRCVLYSAAVLPDIRFEYIQNSIKPGVQICGISGGTDIVGCFVAGVRLAPTFW